ncbi:MAG: hypothetical protein AAB354_14430 [candidate division KSB1 bacterium]
MKKNHRRQQRDLFAHAAEFLQWQELPPPVRTHVQSLLAQLLLAALQVWTLPAEAKGDAPCSPKSL